MSHEHIRNILTNRGPNIALRLHWEMQLPEGGQANDQREPEPQPGISLTRRGCCTNNQPEPTIRRERDHTDARDKVKEGSESNGTPRSRGTRFLIESPAPAGTKEHVANQFFAKGPYCWELFGCHCCPGIAGGMSFSGWVPITPNPGSTVANYFKFRLAGTSTIIFADTCYWQRCERWLLSSLLLHWR